MPLDPFVTSVKLKRRGRAQRGPDDRATGPDDPGAAAEAGSVCHLRLCGPQHGRKPAGAGEQLRRTTQLRRWLRPGGRLCILFLQSGREGGPPFDRPIPAMRALFSAWEWPVALTGGLPHGLGTVEQPPILTREG